MKTEVEINCYPKLETKTEMFDRWFAKDGWDSYTAAYLILGFDPDIRGIGRDKITEILAHRLYTCEEFFHRVTDLDICLEKEVWTSLNIDYGDVVSPIRIAQWVADSNFDDLDTDYSAYIKRHIPLQDNTWIDNDYSLWASKAIWEFDDAVMLLCGIPKRHKKTLEILHFDNHRRLAEYWTWLDEAVEAQLLSVRFGKKNRRLLIPNEVMQLAYKHNKVHHTELLECFGIVDENVKLKKTKLSIKHDIDCIPKPDKSKIKRALREIYYELSECYTKPVKNEDIKNALKSNKDKYDFIKAILKDRIVWENYEGENSETLLTTSYKFISSIRAQLKKQGKLA